MIQRNGLGEPPCRPGPPHGGGVRLLTVNPVSTSTVISDVAADAVAEIDHHVPDVSRIDKLYTTTAFTLCASLLATPLVRFWRIRRYW